MDYTATNRAEAFTSIKRQLREHSGRNSDLLIVIDEYEKLDCATRNFWRQILLVPEQADIQFNRYVDFSDAAYQPTAVIITGARHFDRA
jgi:hypothetical protein